MRAVLNPDYKNKYLSGLCVALVLQVIAAPVFASDVYEQPSVSGLLAGVIQCQDVSDAPGFSNICESAVPFQLEFDSRLTEVDQVFFKLGFAAGNGLNGYSPFAIAPWAADLEDDVKDINGRNRDYLLNAWYKHSFSLGDEQSLGVTMGIIDATDYLDENVYVNDEFTQFMNSALTNGPNVFLPSYDIGVALEWDSGQWSLRGVLMEIGTNDDGNNFSFYGLQAGYSVGNSLGAGNYRIIVAGTSRDFLNTAGTEVERHTGALISFNQEFGKVTGGWIRIGKHYDDAVFNYNVIYSGGVDIKGDAWGCSGDNIGLGFAYLSDGNLDIDSSQLAEAYYRWPLGEVFALTADIQYQNDDYKTGQGPDGWTYGLRAVAEF